MMDLKLRMRLIFWLLFVTCPCVALLFLGRLLCAPFSTKISGQMKKHPILHFVWGFFAFVGALAILGVLDPGIWPPKFVERRAQRQKVIARVQSAGGWEALKRDCTLLVQTNESLYWTRWHTNDLLASLPAIAVLQPQQVKFISPKLLVGHLDEPRVPVVHIKVFGMHATGAHSTPYFGLDVVAAPIEGNYIPKPAIAASGNAHRNYRKVAEGVYEVF